MIAIDASAICAIVFDEPERDRFLAVLEATDGAVISPVNFWEACVSVQNRRAVDGGALVSDALFDAGVVVAQIGRVETELAFDAWRRFGKGRHAAALNLGDCFAYALARSRDLPLLFKGDDFAQTDVRSAA